MTGYRDSGRIGRHLVAEIGEPAAMAVQGALVVEATEVIQAKPFGLFVASLTRSCSSAFRGSGNGRLLSAGRPPPIRASEGSGT